MKMICGCRSWRNHSLKRWRSIDRRNGINDMWRQVDMRKKIAGIPEGGSQRVGEGCRLSSRNRLAEIGLEGCGKIK